MYIGVMMTDGAPTSISNVIEEWFSKHHRKAFKRYSMLTRWEEIVGLRIAKNTRPVRFYREALVVMVRNSVWMQELEFLKPQILEKIRASSPEVEVNDIVFKVGDVG